MSASPHDDYIKGKADIFSFVLDVLETKIHTYGEIMDRVQCYVNTPPRNPASISNGYLTGVRDAVDHFRRYFVPREDSISSDTIQRIRSAVEEQWRQLTLPKMTHDEHWVGA